MNKSAFTIEDDIHRMQDEVFQLRLQHVVLVEGKSDEPFWKHVLEQAIPQRFKIYAYVNFPTPDSSGKTALTTHYLPYASRDLVFCLDSDYDYLLGNQHLQRPFVFQTYVYSVENFLCYAPSLTQILVIGTRTEQATFDFEHFFSRYSECVYGWLLCQLYTKLTNQTEQETPPVISAITNPDDNLIQLAQQVDDQIGLQFAVFKQSAEFENFTRQLINLGLNNQNAYLFIRGHDLLEKVTLKLLKQVAAPIIENEFSKLNNEDKAVYASYQKVNMFEKLLHQNITIENCDFYEKIISDIREAFI